MFMRKNISGSIIPLFAILLTALIGLIGLSTDLTYSGMVRSSIERACDASVRAGRQSYKKLGKDPGLALNDAARVFRMNIANQIGGANVVASTGYKTPTTLSYSYTYTTADGISNVFRGQSVSFQTDIDLTAQTITVTGMVTPQTFFSTNNQPVTIYRLQYLIGSPKDIVLVVDLSREDRLKTFKTYVGTADRDDGMTTMTYNDVILYQAMSNKGAPIVANGYTISGFNIRDVLYNTPGVDIDTAATYTDGFPCYKVDGARGWVTNNFPYDDTRLRTTLSGYRISELMALLGMGTISAADAAIETSYTNNQGTVAQIQAYFNQAAPHIESTASVQYGAMIFADELAGSLKHRFALVTYSTTAKTADWTQNFMAMDMETNNMSRQVTTTFPFYNFTTTFTDVSNKLAIVDNGGTGLTMASPLLLNGFPNSTTDIRDGLNAANSLFNSGSSTFERIVILFASNDPSHSYAVLGTTVANLVANGVTVYSIVLTLSLPPGEKASFQSAIENNGGEPVIFVDDPADVDNAFLTIADDIT